MVSIVSAFLILGILVYEDIILNYLSYHCVNFLVGNVAVIISSRVVIYSDCTV